MFHKNNSFMRKRRPRGQIKKTCSKCGNELEESRQDKQRYCKGCHAAQMRATRPKHSELPEESRKKANCRAHTKVYLKRGNIIRTPCIVCGDINSEAHHEDYNKPKEVIWYCRKHHLEYHNRNKEKSSNGTNKNVIFSIQDMKEVNRLLS